MRTSESNRTSGAVGAESPHMLSEAGEGVCNGFSFISCSSPNCHELKTAGDTGPYEESCDQSQTDTPLSCNGSSINGLTASISRSIQHRRNNRKRVGPYFSINMPPRTLIPISNVNSSACGTHVNARCSVEGVVQSISPLHQDRQRVSPFILQEPEAATFCDVMSRLQDDKSMSRAPYEGSPLQHMTPQSAPEEKPNFNVDVPPSPPIRSPRAVQADTGFNATQITPHLWLGSAEDITNVSALRSRRIRYILNVAKECDIPDAILESNYHLRSRGKDEAAQASSGDSEPLFVVKHISLVDNSDERIYDVFHECFQFMYRALTGALTVEEERDLMRSALQTQLGMSREEADEIVSAAGARMQDKHGEEGRRPGGSLIVHCRMGISRSASVVIAYLMTVGSGEQVVEVKNFFNLQPENMQNQDVITGNPFVVFGTDDAGRNYADTIGSCEICNSCPCCAESTAKAVLTTGKLGGCSSMSVSPAFSVNNSFVMTSNCCGVFPIPAGAASPSLLDGDQLRNNTGGSSSSVPNHSFNTTITDRTEDPPNYHYYVNGDEDSTDQNFLFRMNDYNLADVEKRILRCPYCQQHTELLQQFHLSVRRFSQINELTNKMVCAFSSEEFEETTDPEMFASDSYSHDATRAPSESSVGEGRDEDTQQIGGGVKCHEDSGIPCWAVRPAGCQMAINFLGGTPEPPSDFGSELCITRSPRGQPRLAVPSPEGCTPVVDSFIDGISDSGLDSTTTPKRNSYKHPISMSSAVMVFPDVSSSSLKARQGKGPDLYLSVPETAIRSTSTACKGTSFIYVQARQPSKLRTFEDLITVINRMQQKKLKMNLKYKICKRCGHNHDHLCTNIYDKRLNKDNPALLLFRYQHPFHVHPTTHDPLMDPGADFAATTTTRSGEQDICARSSGPEGGGDGRSSPVKRRGSAAIFGSSKDSLHAMGETTSPCLTRSQVYTYTDYIDVCRSVWKKRNSVSPNIGFALSLRRLNLAHSFPPDTTVDFATANEEECNATGEPFAD